MAESIGFDVSERPEEAIEMATQAARSRLDPNHPRQVAAIQLLTDICLAFCQNKHYEQSFRLIRMVCTTDLGPNKARAVVTTCREFMRNQQIHYIRLIVHRLLPLKGKAKVAVIREIGRMFKRRDQLDDMQQVATALINRSEDYAKRAGLALLQDKEATNEGLMNHLSYDIEDTDATLRMAIKWAKSRHDQYDSEHIQSIQTAQSIALAFIDRSLYKPAMQILGTFIVPSMTYLKSQSIIAIAGAFIDHKKPKVCIKIVEKLVLTNRRPHVYCCQAIVYRLFDAKAMKTARAILAVLEKADHPDVERMLAELKGYMATFFSKGVQSVQKLSAGPIMTDSQPSSVSAEIDVFSRKSSIEGAPPALRSISSYSEDVSSKGEDVSVNEISGELESQLDTFCMQSRQLLTDNNIHSPRHFLMFSDKPQKKDIPTYFITEFNVKSVIYVRKTKGVYETFKFQLESKDLAVNDVKVSRQSPHYSTFLSLVRSSIDAYKKRQATAFRDSVGAV